jgi:phage FluMu gp28-like protein
MSAPITEAQWAEARRTATEVLPGLVSQIGLPKALISYQARALALLEDTACRVLFIEKSRRIGLTFGFASYAALRAGRAKSAGGMDVMYISYSQEMTREFIDACAMWARAFSNAALAVDEFLFDDSDKDGDRSIQAFRIRFASGFEILALSSAPRTLRGKQGVVMIDEAAFVDSLPELLKAALAFLMWGGQVVVCSTHNGTENEFNKQIQDILAGRKPYKHLRIDFDQALTEGLYERICLVNGIEWTPEGEAKWRQEIIDFYGDGADEELFCIPTAGTGAWLPAPLIEARMTVTNPIIRVELPGNFLHLSRLERAMLMAEPIRQVKEAIANLDRDRRHALGFDFARVADLSVATLLSIDRMLKREEALTLEMRNVPGDEQKLLIRMILEGAPRMVGAAFDATGMGWTVAEDMGRIFGFRTEENDGGLIAAVKFSADWYRFNMPPLKAAFEDDAIALVKDDDHLADVRLVRVINGVPKVPDVRTGEGSKKRHGDFAIALALGHWASRQQWFQYEYTSIRDLQRQMSGHNGGPPFDDDDEEFHGRRHW